jgi:hypothetical protein
MNKLGVIVPYRNRPNHLSQFKTHITDYLNNQNIQYELIVVEQSDLRPFNRGKLLNIGVKKAYELGCTYVALHDVDMLPIDVDYSPTIRPTHLATDFISEDGTKSDRIIFDEYFGGVTLFPIHTYFQVNGYSNNYWGWGYEDDDLLFRCKETISDWSVKNKPIIVRNSAGYEFNGWDSGIKIPFKQRLRSFTFFLSINPYPLEISESRNFDEYGILSIPGYDLSFSYDSFKRYKFEIWNSNKELLSLKSNLLPVKQTTLAATVDFSTKLVKFFVDGELVDKHIYSGNLYNYWESDFIHLGNSPSFKYNNRIPYKGVIDYFAYFNHSLEDAQIKEISDNKYLGLTEAFGNYVAPHTLVGCYDMKIGTNHIVYDISGNNKNGSVYHCNRVSVKDVNDFIEIPIPYRRNSTFKLLDHPNNGFYENKWIYTETRKNQIYFYNNVLQGKTKWKRDGYDNCKYTELSYTPIGNYHHVAAEL